MERLSIDEVMEHCRRTCEYVEIMANAQGKTQDDITSHKYWEHYQVEEWLKELKAYRELEEQGLLLRLPKEILDIDKNAIQYALVKAVNLVRYGVDVDSKLDGAVQTSYALHEAYMRGTKDATDRMYEMKSKIRNKAIEDYSAKVYEELLLFDLNHGYPTISDCKTILSDVAEKMKGNNND